MFNQPDVPLTMPRLYAGTHRDDSGYWSVPMDAVDAAIDVLRAYIAHWEPPEYTRPADEHGDDLVAAAADALAALLRARAVNHRRARLDALLQQIDEFFWWGDARAWLEEARASSEYADIAEALIALYDQRQKQRAQPTA